MILAILQARISSSRLPGKVLKELCGKPMIVHEVERIKKSKLVDKIVVATSIDKSDDVLVNVCQKYGIEVFRGSLNNVLERFYDCARIYKPAHIVRLTGDCPLIDWVVIDKVIHLHLKKNNDYTSNTMELTYPDGLDVEIMNFKTLEKVYLNALLPSELEHVTTYIYNNKSSFKTGYLRNDLDLSDLRLTVDEEADFKVIEIIYNHLYIENHEFCLKDIVEFLNQHKEVLQLNSQILRNEGLAKSLKEDIKFKEEHKNG